jgi:hypothetical protein
MDMVVFTAAGFAAGDFTAVVFTDAALMPVAREATGDS